MTDNPNDIPIIFQKIITNGHCKISREECPLSEVNPSKRVDDFQNMYRSV